MRRLPGKPIKRSRPSKRKRENSGRSRAWIHKLMHGASSMQRVDGIHAGMQKGTVVNIFFYPDGNVVPRVSTPGFRKVKSIPLNENTPPVERAIGESIQRIRQYHNPIQNFEVKQNIRSGAKEMRVASPAEIKKLDDLFNNRVWGIWYNIDPVLLQQWNHFIKKMNERNVRLKMKKK